MTERIDPDWKQDQAETSRLRPRPRSEVQSREAIARIAAKELGEDFDKLVDFHFVHDTFCQDDFYRVADAILAIGVAQATPDWQEIPTNVLHAFSNAYKFTGITRASGNGRLEFTILANTNGRATIDLMPGIRAALRGLTLPSASSPAQAPVGWFIGDAEDGYHQVAKEFEGNEGTTPLYASLVPSAQQNTPTTHDQQEK